MTITSWGFVGFLGISVLAFNVIPRRWRARLAFPSISLIFLLLVTPSLWSASVVLGFVGLVWASTRIIDKWPTRLVRVAVFSMILLVFGWFKGYEFLAFFPYADLIPATIGLSYMLIRSMQLLVDIADTPSLRPGFLQIVSFMTSFASLISGPIQRFQDFRDQLFSMETFALNGEVAFTALKRMIKGYFYVLVLADATKHVWLGLQDFCIENPYPVALAGAQLSFLAHLFFDFAGYMHIVIGAGCLFGLQLPENFNRPWQSKSFLEFWSRWHMTMSNWFRTYVFNAVLMALVKRWPNAKLTDMHAVVAFFITFFLVGVWHGTTWAFVICGLLLGTGASANQIYRNTIRRRLGKKRAEALVGGKFYSSIAAALAFTYICFSVSPLWLSFEQIESLLTNYSFIGLATAELTLFLALLLLLPVVQWRPRLWRLGEFSWGAALTAGMQLAIIDAYAFLFPAIGGAFFYEQF